MLLMGLRNVVVKPSSRQASESNDRETIAYVGNAMTWGDMPLADICVRWGGDLTFVTFIKI